MRLSDIILGEILHYDPQFEKEIDRLLDKNAKYIGSGDYGAAYLLNGKIFKVTTDEIELEHAQILKGKETKNFAFIFDVEIISKKLGIIQMEVLGEYNKEIPDEWIRETEKEAASLGIDPDELDIRPSNVMINNENKLKLVDI